MMELAHYGPIACAIRQAVVNEAPWLLYAPGRKSWSLVITPWSNTAVLNLPRMLAYLSIRASPALQAGAVIEYQRLISVLAHELPIVGEPGLRLKTVVMREGFVEQSHPNCCLLRISDLPWAQSPQIEERASSDDIEATFFVPPNDHATQLSSRFIPGWSGPDLGAPPPLTAEEFYGMLDPLDLTERPAALLRPLASAYLLRHREAEKVRCQLMGHATPNWLLRNDRLEQDVAYLLQRWGLTDLRTGEGPDGQS